MGETEVNYDPTGVEPLRFATIAEAKAMLVKPLYGQPIYIDETYKTYFWFEGIPATELLEDRIVIDAFGTGALLAFSSSDNVIVYPPDVNGDEQLWQNNNLVYTFTNSKPAIINTKTASYTTVASDAGKIIVVNSPININITLSGLAT